MAAGTKRVVGHSCVGRYGVDNVWDAKLADTRGGDDSDHETRQMTVESTEPVPTMEDTTGNTEETAEAFELLDDTTDKKKLDEDDTTQGTLSVKAKSSPAKADNYIVRQSIKKNNRQNFKAKVKRTV